MQELKINCRGCGAKLDLSEFEPFSLLPCPECGATLRVPMRFERYLLEKICGKGGNSVVYRALEPDLARRVAVKVESGDEANHDEIARQFINAARISGKVKHSGVVPVYNCGTCAGKTFLVMRYMEHGDLEQMMKQGKLPEKRKILSWIASLIPLLIEARRLNIVHHDIKPANIMLTADDEAKLGDWDIAECRDGSGSGPSMWASPIYASPERIFSGSEDWKGDIFSLGVTIYELFSGVAPFGLHGSQDEIYARRLNMQFRPLAALVPEIPPVLSLLVSGMLDFSPENRPDYEEIAAILNAVIAQSPLTSAGQ
jgi:serine/threonine-protein kinase